MHHYNDEDLTPEEEYLKKSINRRVKRHYHKKEQSDRFQKIAISWIVVVLAIFLVLHYQDYILEVIFG